MKLRTVLSELPLDSFFVHGLSQLDWDVIVSPEWRSGADSEGVIRLGSLADFREEGAPVEGKGLLLVYIQGKADEKYMHPDKTVIYAFGTMTPSDFQDSFLRLVSRSGVLAVRREQLFKAFLASYDIQQFASRALDVLNNPLLIVNTDGKVLASAGDFPKESADVAAVIDSGYLTDEVRDRMEADGVLNALRDAGHSLISDGEANSAGSRCVASLIYHHHLEMGRMDVFEVKRITGLDLELIDYASSLAGIMIDRLGVAGERVGTGSSVLSDLLSGKVTNVEPMEALRAVRGAPKDGGYVLLRVIGDSEAGRDYYLRAGQVLQGCLKGGIWTVFGNALVVLLALGKGDCVGFDDYNRCERRVMRNHAFVEMLDNNDMYASVSEPFDSLGHISNALKQCIELGRTPSADPSHRQRLRFLWQERFLVLASMARSLGQTDALLDKRVLAMAAYDNKHKTSYLDTAIMSVRFPGSPVEAAEALNVHRNTYFYRVNKIQELFFLNLKDGEDRLAVAFTTHILSGADGFVRS